MATENRARFNNVQVPGLFVVAQESFKRATNNLKKVVTVRSSTKEYEEAGYVTGYGHLQSKPEGMNFSGDARIQGPVKRWVHASYGLMARITREAIDDDRYGFMTGAMRDLGTSAAATLHLMMARPIMTGTATTYHTAGDGLAIFSQSHVRLGGGTWSNLGDAADPTEATLAAAVLNFEAITDHRGKRYDQKAMGVLCGPTHEMTFEKLLESAQEPETNRNAVNALKRRRGLSLTVDKEITDGRWLVYGEKDPDVGLIHFDRVKPTMSRAGDPDNGDAKFYVYCRFSDEVNDPRQMYLVPAL